MASILNYEKNIEEDYYYILGCNELSTSEQILTEYKQLARTCHPDKNLSDEEAVERFQKLQEAKEVLTNEELRRDYDKWRLGGIAMSFRQWKNLSSSAHTSFHWAFKKQQPTIEASPEPHDCFSENEPPRFEMGHNIKWESEQPSSLLKKFRNYEI